MMQSPSWCPMRSFIIIIIILKFKTKGQHGQRQNELNQGRKCALTKGRRGLSDTKHVKSPVLSITSKLTERESPDGILQVAFLWRSRSHVHSQVGLLWRQATYSASHNDECTCLIPPKKCSRLVMGLFEHIKPRVAVMKI